MLVTYSRVSCLGTLCWDPVFLSRPPEGGQTSERPTYIPPDRTDSRAHGGKLLRHLLSPSLAGGHPHALPLLRPKWRADAAASDERELRPSTQMHGCAWGAVERCERLASHHTVVLFSMLRCSGRHGRCSAPPAACSC